MCLSDKVILKVNFQAISESLNPTKRSALEQKVARLEKVVGVGKALVNIFK